MQNRYVFPIFDNKNNIIGLSGRKLEAKSNRPKWIHYGKKSKWIYPSFVNKNYIKDKEEVILVESIGDMLSLWEAVSKTQWYFSELILVTYIVLPHRFES